MLMSHDSDTLTRCFLNDLPLGFVTFLLPNSVFFVSCDTSTSFRCPKTKNLVDHIPIMGRFCIDTIRNGLPLASSRKAHFHGNVLRPDNAQSYNGMTWPSTCFDEEEVGFIDGCMRLGCRENLVFRHEVVYTTEN